MHDVEYIQIDFMNKHEMSCYNGSKFNSRHVAAICMFDRQIFALSVYRECRFALVDISMNMYTCTKFSFPISQYSGVQ